MKKYFLSYSRGDQAFALRFAHDLKTAGVDIWVDQFDIAIGQNWDRAVEAAVRGCEGFIIILSPRSVASENVADEIGVALEGGKHVIPILYEACTVPMRLARVQFIDATSDYQVALQRCRSVVQAASAGASAAVGSGMAIDTSATNISVPEGWDAHVIDTAVERLSAFVGPVAKLLVQKAALSARSETELYRQLAVAIPKETERQRFLAGTGQPPAAPVAPPAMAFPTASAVAAFSLPGDMVDKLSQILTAYLGPMARHVLVAEARDARNRDDLFQRLCERIPSDKERSELLKKLKAS